MRQRNLEHHTKSRARPSSHVFKSRRNLTLGDLFVLGCRFHGHQFRLHSRQLLPPIMPEIALSGKYHERWGTCSRQTQMFISSCIPW